MYLTTAPSPPRLHFSQLSFTTLVKDKCSCPIFFKGFLFKVENKCSCAICFKGFLFEKSNLFTSNHCWQLDSSGETNWNWVLWSTFSIRGLMYAGAQICFWLVVLRTTPGILKISGHTTGCCKLQRKSSGNKGCPLWVWTHTNPQNLPKRGFSLLTNGKVRLMPDAASNREPLVGRARLFVQNPHKLSKKLSQACQLCREFTSGFLSSGFDITVALDFRFDSSFRRLERTLCCAKIHQVSSGLSICLQEQAMTVLGN